MALIETLSAEDLAMMDTYRRYYAWSEDSSHNTRLYTPMESILHEWDIQKSKYLFRLLGDNLRISRHLEYEKSEEELANEISEMMCEDCSWGRVGRNGYAFTKAWNNYMYHNRNNFPRSVVDNLHRLMSDECLISNTYDGDSFEVEMPNGKPYRVNRGCKVSKALGKLADIFDLPGFEDFRICHSLVLNQKHLGGTLTLSIHPMDYMTMSDNESWESCMSWQNEGGYRQGTVEMMNSPSVLVAYMEHSSDMQIDREHSWNDKKWRQLFVVDKNILIGVKDYPYHNDSLGLEIMKWIKDLAEKNLCWKYNEVFAWESNSGGIIPPNKPECMEDEQARVYVELICYNMYNDLGCLAQHFLAWSSNFDWDDVYSPAHHGGAKYLRVKYSGSPQCMICGELDPSFSDESCLACESCQDRLRCDCCGEITCETWEVDGLELCEYCWENRVHKCACCEDEHYDENMVPIFVIPRLTEEDQARMRAKYLRDRGYWNCGFLNSREEIEEAEFTYASDDTEIWMCDNPACLEKWIEVNMLPGCRPHRRHLRWTEDICIFYDELTPEAQEEYTWGGDGDNEKFKATFPDYKAEPTRFIKLL